MEKQPILTAEEALGLVIEVAPEYTYSLVVNLIVGRDYDLGEIEKYLTPEMDIVVCARASEDLGHCYITPSFIEVAKDCASRLQSQGYYVFLRLEVDDYLDFGDYVKLCRCDFVVGECARLLDRIYSLANYLEYLKKFVDKRKHKLPPNLVAEQTKIEDYLDSLWGKYEEVLQLYTENRKTRLEEECEEAWELVEEVEAYLESIIDLRWLHALAMQL
jgi:uncharacterized protein YuzB (UPF0349 family)